MFNTLALMGRSDNFPEYAETINKSLDKKVLKANRDPGTGKPNVAGDKPWHVMLIVEAIWCPRGEQLQLKQALYDEGGVADGLLIGAM